MGPEDLALSGLCREAGLAAALPPDVIGRLVGFAELARAWSSRTDLTAAREPATLAEVLYLDALVLSRPELVPAGVRLLDVGAGVGAPGLALSLLRGDLDVTLVEPRRRRVAFLRTAVGTLGLMSRVRILEQHVRAGEPVPGAPFDAAVSRATFPPHAWLEIAAELAPAVLVLTAQAEPPPAPAGFEPLCTVRYRVPGSGAPRAATRYQRV